MLDAKTWVDNLPGSIEAVFYPKGCGDACVAQAREVYDAFIAAFPEAAATPFLALDVTDWSAPFGVPGDAGAGNSGR